MGLDSRDYYRPGGYRFSFFPPIIKNLIIINVIVFFIQLISRNLIINGELGEAWLTYYFALNPLSYGNFKIWQLITYQFMHGDFVHILFNMFMLWMFGMEIEHIMGSRKFAIFYLLSGFGAGLVQLLGTQFLTATPGVTIGASGAVYGVMIAFAMFFPDRYMFIYFLIPIKAKYLITFLIIIEFFSVQEASVVAHLAHIGGALTGFIFILLDRKNEFNMRRVFNSFKKPNFRGSDFTFKRPTMKRPVNDYEVQDAEYYDINKKNEDEITQADIDRILDKISQSGYQNLTDREKKILFEASKKK